MTHLRWLPTLLLFPALACQPAIFDDNDVTGTVADETGTGDGDGDGESSSSSAGDDGPVYNCDPDDVMPCPTDQKCTVLGPPSAPVYDCVPDDGFRLPFEPCTPAPSNGQDGCPSGFACVPISSESPDSGLCLQLCSVDANCDLSLCAAPPNSLVKVCASLCDPLAPACPEAQDCQRIRQSAFVCQFPGLDDDGTQAQGCDASLDAGCAEGFVCQTGQIVPDCAEMSCCTALCDLSEASPCAAPSLCGDLDLEPLPGLEDVGACYVPQ
ncbi:hypothetical protein ACNOYE_00240 [Nannocystaceae bacterium ST9]